MVCSVLSNYFVKKIRFFYSRCLRSFLLLKSLVENVLMRARVRNASCTVWIADHCHRYSTGTKEVQVRPQDNVCGICGGQSGTGTCCAVSTSRSSTSIIPSKIHTHNSFLADINGSQDNYLLKDSYVISTTATCFGFSLFSHLQAATKFRKGYSSAYEY